MIRRLLSLFLFTVLMTGCNGSDDDKVIWIARDATWYPLNLMGQGNNLLGFTDELLYAIAKEEGIHVELVMTSSNGLIAGLHEGNYSAIISPLLPDSINQQIYHFSKPYYLIGPVLVVEKASDINSLPDMKGKLVGIQTGSYFIFDIERYPDITVTPYENILFALENLSKGQLDGVIMDSVAAHVYTSSFYKDKLEIASSTLTQGGLRLMTLKNNDGSDFLEKFNRGLLKMKESGKYEALLDKWNLYNPEEKE